MISNAAWRHGGASLFFTTFTGLHANHGLAVFDHAGLASVQPNGRMELERHCRSSWSWDFSVDHDDSPELTPFQKAGKHYLDLRMWGGTIPGAAAGLGICHCSLHMPCQAGQVVSRVGLASQINGLTQVRPARGTTVDNAIILMCPPSGIVRGERRAGGKKRGVSRGCCRTWGCWDLARGRVRIVDVSTVFGSAA
jgi:hypothetical protein